VHAQSISNAVTFANIYSTAAGLVWVVPVKQINPGSVGFVSPEGVGKP